MKLNWKNIRVRAVEYLMLLLSFFARKRKKGNESPSVEELQETKRMPFRHARHTKLAPDAEMVEQALNVLKGLKEEVGDDFTVRQVTLAEHLLDPSKRKPIPRNLSTASFGTDVHIENEASSKGFFRKLLTKFFGDISWAIFMRQNSEWALPSRAEWREIKCSVIASRAVREAIHSSAEIRGVDVRQATLSAEKIFDTMAAEIRMPIIRFFAWGLRKIFRVFYPFGIRVDPAEIEAVTAAARAGPVIFLPTHKSYMDFLILHFLCFKYNLPIPHVFAGENLNFPLIGRALRYCGAFFMKRTFQREADPVYRVVYAEYVKNLLQRGHAVEAFIEGRRSRSGKVLMPKPGFLRTIIDAVIDEEIIDVYLVPISIDYDRIMESASYIRELSGGAKSSERLVSFVYSSFLLFKKFWDRKLSFGHVNVSFTKPISLQAYMATMQDSMGDLDRAPSPSFCPAPVPLSTVSIPRQRSLASLTTRKYISIALSFRVMYECNIHSTVLPGALVGTILLTHFGRGIRMDTLLEEVGWLREEILARGGKVAQMDGNISSVVQSVLHRVLESKEKNKLIKRHKGILITSLYSPAERLELTLFRNSLIHYFVAEAIVCAAMYASEREASNTVQLMVVTGVGTDAVIKHVEYISKLLKFEFVFKPSPGLSVIFKQTVEFMTKRGILSHNEETNSIAVLPSGTTNYIFLCSLLWPFIDGYWICALSLLYLLPDRMVDEERLLQWQQGIGERLYFESAADLYEAVSKETLQNALALFETWSVVQFLNIEGTSSSPSSSRRVVQLTEKFRCEGKITEIVKELGTLRKQTTASRSRRFMAQNISADMLAIEAVKSAQIHKTKQSA